MLKKVLLSIISSITLGQIMAEQKEKTAKPTKIAYVFVNKLESCNEFKDKLTDLQEELQAKEASL